MNLKLVKLGSVAAIGVSAVYLMHHMGSKNIMKDSLDREDYDGWTVAHFMLHFGITALDYRNWPYSIALTLLWEGGEPLLGKYWAADDIMFDVKTNTLGMMAGMAFNYYLLN